MHSLSPRFPRKALVVALFGGTMLAGTAVSTLARGIAWQHNPDAQRRPMMLAAACNPCAAKKACNPCNPCAAKKACNPCNPCAAKKACNPCNPCAAKKGCNPCNPCGGAKVKASAFKRPCGVAAPSRARLAGLEKEGERLWKDTSLSSNGLSCNTCHTGMGSLNASFAQPYPHRVAMPQQMAGVEAVDADEMVQFCMLVPMQAKALPWESRDLAALTAYTLKLQKSFNPCAAKRAPARGCNPCNPCAAKKNPCNPCNPCAAKKKSG